MLKTFYGTALFIAFLMHPFFSQAQMQEIGLRVSTNLTNLSPSFIYKKQIGENLYKRYNGGLANLNYSNGSKTGNRLGFNAFLSMGKEKRRDIGNRLKFINGLQYVGGFSLNDATTESTNSTLKQTVFNGNLGLGYLLGVQFDLSPTFYINLETIPGGSISYQSSRTKQTNIDPVTNATWGLGGDFSNSVVINIVYCFSKK